MADTVRYLLEEMVPELEALEQRGYFSRAEIKAVVQKRQDFEYALKRKAAVREDYLRYIEYEERLEELRASRRSSRSISGKAGLAEYCIVRRIHFVYERATRKFRGDLDLWSRWLRFCQRARSSKQMSKVLTKALQLHSGCAALWTYAAAWEFESNLNAAAARALMQRGLRMCKHAPQLWHEYFRLELLYALRLRERRRVLGIGAGDDDGMALGAEGEEGEGGDEAAAAVAAVLNGAVAQVVYRNAIAAFPDSVPFRAKFLEILAPLHFPGRASLEEAIYDSVAADFGGSAEAWDLRARRHVLGLAADCPTASHAAAVRAAVGVYEQGLSAVRTPEMAGLLLAFLQQQAAALDVAAEGGSSGEEGRQRREAAEWLRQRTQEAFEEAAADGLLTEALRLEGIAFFLHCGDAHAAAAAARAGTQAMPQSAALWQQLLSLEAVLAAEQLGASSPAGQQQGSSGGSSEESSDEEELPLAPTAGAASLAATAATATQHSSGAAQKRLEETALAALRAVPAADAVPVWLAAVELLCAGGCSLQALAQQLVQAAMRQAKGPVEGGLGTVAAVMLAALHRAGGIAAARALYRVLLPLPPPGGAFFRAMLRLEAENQAMAASGSEAQAAGTRAAVAAPLSDRQLAELFEAATDAYGAEDAQLWLQYAEWQASRGGPAADGAAAVYWKARKMLRRPEEFEAGYHLRFKLQPGAVA